MPRQLRSQRGVGLVELMVSITIGLVILAGVLQLYATSMENQRSQEGFARIQENMRYLLNRLETDISQAGFTGCFPFTSDRITVTLQNDVGVGMLYDFSSFITGTNDTNDNGGLLSDTLTIRYASGRGAIPLASPMANSLADVVLDTNDPDYDSLEQHDIVMVSDCSRAAVFMITNDPGGDGALKHNTTTQDGDGQKNVTEDLENQFGLAGVDGGSRAFVYSGATGAHSYAIRTSAAAGAGQTCATATPQFCAMFRNNVELVDGVEDFQLEFGWRTAAGNLRFATAAGVGAANWSEVDRVRVNLTFNSVQRSRANDGDELVRRTVERVVMIRNQLPAI
ncbi:hypothetical protein FKG94_20135 [Exilibacterium tricleocarpae]|uniref:Prepilin-type N-terminal cleavage/methylation domain-containing protein n=1 Tax=Exilibacterium tricleocarpae TaxID=2591008 RepID=A0A545T1Y2_9GAMM|nr:PilW family protein [Exilibacterium tricleocarpae]TQV71220.1 hypothetical protein FKG94_20135 [Exilibacterium tricleocarpae]